MIVTVILVVALFASSAASGPSGSHSFGGYNPQQQLQQQYPPQQQDRWYSEASPTPFNGQSITPTSDSTTSQEVVEPPPLPEGWSEHFDPNSGQYYYYNAADGTTSWDRPLPPETTDQSVVENENKGEGDSQPMKQELESIGVTDIVQDPTQEQERKEIPEDLVLGANNGISEKGPAAGPSTQIENWQSDPSPHMKQPGPTEAQLKQTSWGGQEQIDHRQANEWSSTPPIQQPSDGNKWDRSNSTETSIAGGESETQKIEYQGQPPQSPQERQERPPGWGLPTVTKSGDSSQKPVEPWGVPKSTGQRHPYNTQSQKQSQPPSPDTITKESSSNFSSDSPSGNAGWGTTKPAESFPHSDASSNSNAQYNHRESWQDPYPTTADQKSPESQLRRHGPPQPQPRGPPQLQQPMRPQYPPRQYPPQPYGSYNPNVPPTQNQYDTRAYPGGYPPQQQTHSQPSNPGQLVSQGNEAGTSAMKEALSTTWKGILGFGNRTREVVGTARDQAVAGATAAGQTISEKSSSFWETAKSTVGGVFENNDSGSAPPYSLSGHSGQPNPDGRDPRNYHARPAGFNQAYPNAPGGPGGRGPPARNSGPQRQAGPYGSRIGQQPPQYGGSPQGSSVQTSGQQQRPASHQQPPRQTNPQGYPNIYPRRDNPYPQTQKGQQRGPMQSQYGNQSTSPQSGRGGYPAQQRPPSPGPPVHQSNRGPGMTQSPPQKENPSDPWDHPGLTGEY